VKLAIAGGGTGGHLFPGVAVAEEFLWRDPSNEVLFIGTERGLEKRILPGLGYRLRTIDVEGLKGRGLRSLIGIVKLPWSLVQSMRILGEFSPDMVLGVGGYASGPVVAAALMQGIPAAIAEQNAIPGETNRLLAKVVSRVFLSFPENRGWAPADRTIVTGNPIRAGLLERATGPEKHDRFTVLVFGGSQGAHMINEAVVEALDHLGDILGRIRIIHQTGNDDLERVKKAYEDKTGQGLAAEALPFINDMGAAYKLADLLVCRAGATSIAEITACGKAAVYIPFPFAVADHQTKNAEALAAAGAAVMLPQKEMDGRRLAAIITDFFNSPEKIRAMERASAQLGHPYAARQVVDECINMMKGRVGFATRSL
jgi:UDP-N-acetylglucosamine--N-acetylmuramyl-(pentapeptide) pyrophosphoryl-undecaprenol N-acetylglucosamine transferase